MRVTVTIDGELYEKSPEFADTALSKPTSLMRSSRLLSKYKQNVAWLLWAARCLRCSQCVAGARNKHGIRYRGTAY